MAGSVRCCKCVGACCVYLVAENAERCERLTFSGCCAENNAFFCFAAHCNDCAARENSFSARDCDAHGVNRELAVNKKIVSVASSNFLICSYCDTLLILLVL